jgi:Flp pilus assembly pilin Flp
MRGSRFGTGATAGLLFGIVAVALAGFGSSLFSGLHGSFGSTPQLVSNSASSTTAAETSHGQNSGNANYSASRAAASPNPFAIIFAPAAGGGESPSSLGMMASQPALLDAFVVLPVLAAVGVGAVVYRVGLRRAEEED